MDIVGEVTGTTVEYLKGKRIGVVCDDLIENLGGEVKASLGRAMERFQAAGAELVEVDLGHLKYSVSVYYIVSTCEASSNLARFDGIHYGFSDPGEGKLEQTYKNTRSKGLGDEVKRRILLGTYALSSGYSEAYYKKACQVRRLIYDDFQQALKICDGILLPVCASTAFPLAGTELGPVERYRNDLYTVPVSLAGLPGLALPFGTGENQLPTGFQLVGKAFGEKDLLCMGRAFELAD